MGDAMAPKATIDPKCGRAEECILYVGDYDPAAEDDVGPELFDVCFVAFSEITADLLEALEPSIIYSPLLTPNFDSTELAQRLQEFGFKGKYCAVVKSVPVPQLIKNEVRMAAPLVNYDLVVTESDPSHRN
ncbi:MAG: hypothetical protein AAF618_08715 [Pseudomonadota bacterium]